MVDTVELRKGNYVYDEDKDFHCVGGYDLIEENDYQPIHLTAEILERCGFVFTNGFKANGGEIEVEKYKLGDWIALISSTGNIEFAYRLIDIDDTPLLYLHQFQNLHFALTGKELQFQKENTLAMNK